MNPAIIVLAAIAALAFATGLLDFNVDFNVDWKMLGIGFAAALLLLMLTKPALVHRAARRVLK